MTPLPYSNTPGVIIEGDGKNSDALIAWVSSKPSDSHVHIYLRRQGGVNDRRLQRILLSMGCTVTRRLSPALA